MTNLKALLFSLALLTVGTAANAQFDVQEVDGSNKVRALGHDVHFSLFSRASAETDRVADQGGRLSSYNYLTAATRVAGDYRLALRLPFQYNTAGTDRFDGDKQNSSDLFLQDVIISLQQYDLLQLPWDLGLYWEGRVYLPTSKNSSQQGLITRLRNEFILTKIVNRFIEVEYDQKFSYYAQSRATYSNTFRDPYDFEVTTVSNTKRTELDHWVVAWGKITPQSGIGWIIGQEVTTWNASATENKSKPAQTFVKTGPQVRFPLGNNANFILAYTDKVDTGTNRSEFGRFLAKNTEIALLSFIGF